MTYAVNKATQAKRDTLAKEADIFENRLREFMPKGKELNSAIRNMEALVRVAISDIDDE